MSPLWRKLILIPIYLFITAIPLAGSIGSNLEYEYSLMVSWLSLVLVPMAGIFLPAQHLPRFDGRFYAAPAMEFFWVLLVGPAIALLSPAYMFMTGLCPCSVTGFSFWMLVMALPAWMLAHVLMWAILRARVNGMSRWRLLAILLLVIVTMMSFDALRLWFNPQKRLVSFFSGFLHGPVYDDWIAVDHGIILARVSHFLLALMLLIVVWSQRQRAMIVAATIVGAGWLGIGIAAAKYPSTSLGKPALDQLLAGKIEGDGFTLHYMQKGGGSGTVHPIKYLRLARDTAFHRSELKPLLGSGVHVEIYVYPDEQRKKLWFGGGSTDVADVRTPSIHIDDDSWPHPTLRHELVHALASKTAFHGLGFHPNMAFTEGLAVALAPDGRSLSLDDGAASVIESGRIASVDKLFSPLFWQASGSRAYTVAGSFIKYLIGQAGFDKVNALYAGKSFSSVFGQDQERVIADWKAAIAATFDKERHAVFSEALFRYPGVFADRCPHSKEDLERKRESDIYVRLRQPLQWDAGEDYLPWRADMDPKDRNIRLKIWRKAINKVAMDRVVSVGRLETWQEALNIFRRFPPKTIEDVEAAILESDVARLIGDTALSINILEKLQAEDKRTFFGFSNQREIAARLAIESDLVDDQALEWRRFLAGWRRNIPDDRLFAGPWITTYLKLRNLKASRISRSEIDQAFLLDPVAEGLPETFRLEWMKILAGKFMAAESYDQAGKAYRAAANVASGSLQELLLEHARRADFYQLAGALRPSADRKPDQTEMPDAGTENEF